MQGMVAAFEVSPIVVDPLVRIHKVEERNLILKAPESRLPKLEASHHTKWEILRCLLLENKPKESLQTSSVDEVNARQITEAASRRMCNAVMRDRLDELDELLSSGFPVDQPYKGLTPLMYATEYGNVEAATQLIRAGANLNWGKPNAGSEVCLTSCQLFDDLPISYGLTALVSAVANGPIRMVNLLLAYKADPNLALARTDTPLAIAVAGQSICTVSVLLQAKADPNVRTETNQILLELTTNPEIRELLLQHGARTRLQRSKNITINNRSKNRGASVTDFRCTTKFNPACLARYNHTRQQNLKINLPVSALLLAVNTHEKSIKPSKLSSRFSKITLQFFRFGNSGTHSRSRHTRARSHAWSDCSTLQGSFE